MLFESESLHEIETYLLFYNQMRAIISICTNVLDTARSYISSFLMCVDVCHIVKKGILPLSLMCN